MNHCGGIHQFASSREEMRSSVSFDNGVGVPMACPTPRRLSLFNEPVRPLRWQMCHQSEAYESKAGSELLDIIFAKVASSPPFFSGSPPSRVSNPLIQDARFRDDKISSVSMIPNPPASSPSPSPSARQGGGGGGGGGGGCLLLSTFGNKPAVRVEGFDCLDRENRRNCSIPTLA